MKMFVAAISVSSLLLSGCAHDSSMNDRGMASSSQSIADVAMSTGMHGTLVTALKTAGLAGMLMESGSYTVFAPTDEAFAKLPAGTVEMLLLPENRDKLRSVLQYHVVPGRVTARQVMGMSSGTSVSGKSFTVMTMGDRVMINDAHVIKADVMASNGIVHVIDTVLMPPGM